MIFLARSAITTTFTMPNAPKNIVTLARTVIPIALIMTTVLLARTATYSILANEPKLLANTLPNIAESMKIKVNEPENRSEEEMKTRKTITYNNLNNLHLSIHFYKQLITLI